MEYCEPVLVEFPGWLSDISGKKSWVDLPDNLTDIINFVEAETGAKLKILSIGADREETIFL